MLNIRITLSWIFGILFVLSVTSITWGQQENSTLSESETIKIIQEIHKVEKNLLKEMYELDKQMRGHVDDSISGINKQITDMNRELGSVQSTTKYTFWILSGICLPVAFYFLTLIEPRLIFWQKKNIDSRQRKDTLEDIPYISPGSLVDNPLNQTSPKGPAHNE